MTNTDCTVVGKGYESYNENFIDGKASCFSEILNITIMPLKFYLVNFVDTFSNDFDLN